MANVSRNVPPCAAVITIRPAAGGPSSTTFHSSGEKEALFVMSRSCAPGDAGHLKSLAAPGCALHPAGVRYRCQGYELGWPEYRWRRGCEGPLASASGSGGPSDAHEIEAEPG